MIEVLRSVIDCLFVFASIPQDRDANHPAQPASSEHFNSICSRSPGSRVPIEPFHVTSCISHVACIVLPRQNLIETYA